MDILTAILARNQGGEPLAKSEIKTKTIADNIVFGFTDGVCQLTYSIGFKDKGSYIVNWGGEEFECAGKYTWLEQEDMSAVCVGNLALYGLEDTGEPFLFIDGGGVTLIVDIANIGVEGTVGRKISIVSKIETIHPIDPKYIPGAVLPVVEIATEPTADGALLTEAEAAKMDEVFALGLPIVGKFVYDSSLQITSIFYHTILGTNNAFTLNAGTLIFTIQKTDDGWVFVGREPE